jgi:hypothetical protein
MVVDGFSDLAIAAKLGVGRMAAYRHRKAHLDAAVQAVVSAARSHSSEAERERMAASAARSQLEAAKYFSLERIAAGMQHVEARIERSSAASELAGHHTATAALCGQAHSVIKTRLDIGGHSSRNSPVGSPERFSVNIYLGGRLETISTTVRTIEGSPEPESDMQAGQDYQD